MKVTYEAPDTLTAHAAGKPIATLRFFNNRWHYHSRVFTLVFRDFLSPTANREVMEVLLRDLERHLAPHDPLLLRTVLREDDGLIPYLKSAGFREFRRVYEPTLDAASFHPGSLVQVERDFAALGYRLVTLAALRREGLPLEAFRALYDEVYADTSTAAPATPELFTPEEWRGMILEADDLLPEASFVALHGDTLAGFSTLFRGEQGGELEAGTFGTARAFRRHHREIVLTLKLSELAFAKAEGYGVIRAEIDADNPWVLYPCAELPFVQSQDLVSLVRVPRWTVLPPQ